ncbi:DUF4352 domain-containing protein [Thermosphaera sp.]
MKAISPVIATVIIVAVAIAISIAVALWLTGIVGGFTAVENLQITYAYANKIGNEWLVTLQVENKGTGTATIDEIFINGVPIRTKNTTYLSISDTSIPAGGKANINITLNTDLHELTGLTFSSGQQIEIKLHTASGKEYPKMVTLP